MPWTGNPERPWADDSGSTWEAEHIWDSIVDYFGFRGMHGEFIGSIDRRDHARFTPQDAIGYCSEGDFSSEGHFPIGQYMRELSKGVNKNTLSWRERQALWQADLRFARQGDYIYLYDQSGLPGPEGTPESFNFATNEAGAGGEVYLVDAYGQRAGWPDTQPLPEYPAPGPAAHNDQLPAYFRERGLDPQSHAPWQAPELPPAYTPPPNADVARAASAGQEQRATTANQQAPHPQTGECRRRDSSSSPTGSPPAQRRRL